MSGTMIMAAIYLAVLLRISEEIAKVLYAEWTRPKRNKSAEHMAYLRDQARREGRYFDLGDQ